MENEIKSYKDLIVWQKSIELVNKIYILTSEYPKEELYVLTAHTRRTAISIPSNIAEGRSRGSKKMYLRYLLIALGSCSELETQIIIAQNQLFSNNLDFTEVDGLRIEVTKILHTMISSLKREL